MKLGSRCAQLSITTGTWKQDSPLVLTPNLCPLQPAPPPLDLFSFFDFLNLFNILSF